MPGLDLSQLSSNWKQLQGKLQAEKPKDAPKIGLKRKRQEEDRSIANGFKRTKSWPTKRKSTARMGSSSSRQEDGKSIDQNYSNLAKQHGISRHSITQAYGSSSSNGAASRTFTDDINGGLHPTHKIGKYIALDCEMVGTGPPPHDENVLARASVVNFHGEQIYDSYVLPPPNVIVEDYRTFVSGITPQHLLATYARPLPQVQKDISRLLDGRILVGHALRNDLDVLLLSHPKRDLRDTSRYPPFRALNHGRPPALRHLARVKLDMAIQTGEHSSVEDARATMMLFQMEKVGFEEDNRKMFGPPRPVAKARGEKTVEHEVSDGDEDDADIIEDDSGDEADGWLNAEESRMLANGETRTERPPKTAKKKSKKKKRTKRK